MMSMELSAEAFAESKFDLPEAGRWTDLAAGEVVTLDPPPPEHGTVVLNFSKALADHLQQFPEGYACYELGLVVNRKPDSVYCPAISYFASGTRFEELDKVISEIRPALIVEVVSTPDRRRFVRRRAQEFLEWGVSVVIAVELRDKVVTMHSIAGGARVLGSTEEIEFADDWRVGATPFLPRFCVAINDLFREPEWMRSHPKGRG